MRPLRCLFGRHDPGAPTWEFVGTDGFYWYRRCKRCGHKEIVYNLGCPPARFVDGREVFMPELMTREQRAAGVEW